MNWLKGTTTQLTQDKWLIINPFNITFDNIDIQFPSNTYPHPCLWVYFLLFYFGNFSYLSNVEILIAEQFTPLHWLYFWNNCQLAQIYGGGIIAHFQDLDKSKAVANVSTAPLPEKSKKSNEKTFLWCCECSDPKTQSLVKF